MALKLQVSQITLTLCGLIQGRDYETSSLLYQTVLLAAGRGVRDVCGKEELAER